MKNVAKIDISRFNQKDFESLMCRKFLLKAPHVCLFRIEGYFDNKNSLPMKIVMKYLKDRGRIICLDIRDSESKEAIMSILPYADSIKVKYEHIQDKYSLGELLAATEQLYIPTILYIKAEHMPEFVNLYRTYPGDHRNITRIVDVSYINPEEMLPYMDDRTYLLDCPACFLKKHNLKSCTSGILDISTVIRKVGRHIEYSDYDRAKEPFRTHGICTDCKNSFSCIGMDKDCIEHRKIDRMSGCYMSAYEVFRQTVERMNKAD